MHSSKYHAFSGIERAGTVQSSFQLIASVVAYLPICFQLSSKSRKIDSLESSVSELQQVLQSSSSVASATKLPALIAAQASAEQEEQATSASESTRIAETAEICTQTTETAFMLCAQCSTTQSTLVISANLVSRLCKAHTLRSRFAIYDWNALAKKGGIEITKWYDSFRIDMTALEENVVLVMGKLESLTSERDKLGKQVTHLKEKNQSLDIHVNALKVG